MTEYVYVKPAFEGGRIRMPDRDSTVMPVEGQLVPRIDYYERLIISGDVIVCDPPAGADKPIKPIFREDTILNPGVTMNGAYPEQTVTSDTSKRSR